MATSNPIPSSDPGDLLFNAQKLDEAVNSSDTTFTDRFGSSRKTLAGIKADMETSIGASLTDINTLAGVAASIPAVAAVADDVPAVAAIADDVTTVADNNANITATATNIDNVNAVANNIADLQTFADAVASVKFSDKATMDADLAHAAGVFALVYADSTAGNNGLYYKDGASGAGSWIVYQGDIRAEVDLSTDTEGQTGGNANLGTYVRAVGMAVTTTGRATISAEVTAAGSATVYHCRPSGTGWEVLAMYSSITVSAAGVNDITPSEGLYVTAGDAIFYSMDSGGYFMYFSAGTANGLLVNPKPTYEGQVFSAATTRPALLISVSTSRISALESTKNEHVESIATLEEDATVLQKGGRTELVSTMFPGVALPTGWTAGGAWTVNNGLTPPAVGGWSVYATASHKFTSSHKRRIRCRFTVKDAASIFGVCTRPTGSSNGAVAMVDGTAGKLRIYSWNGSAAGTVTNEVALPAALTVDRDYMVIVEKNGNVSTATFYDTVTQETCSVTETQSSTGRLWHGAAGVLFISGTQPVFQWFDSDHLYPSSPHAVIIGDSITEGNYLLATGTSWAYQLADARRAKGDIVVCGKAGDTAAGAVLRKAGDIDVFTPRYVVIAIGTNDTDQATWRTNVASLISAAEAVGAEPILCTQVPRTAAQALRTAMNADIRSYYFGRYRYIDMALAVSNAHDGVTWDSAYDYGDGTHPNAAGAVKMYTQAMIDAPFLV